MTKHLLLTPLIIGKETIANRLIVAPMAGVTDNPFRRLCKSFGAGHAVSEMIIADTALYAAKSRCTVPTSQVRLPPSPPKWQEQNLISLLKLCVFRWKMGRVSWILTWAALPKKYVVN